MSFRISFSLRSKVVRIHHLYLICRYRMHRGGRCQSFSLERRAWPDRERTARRQGPWMLRQAQSESCTSSRIPLPECVPQASGDEEYKGVGSLFSSTTLGSWPVRAIPGRYVRGSRLATGHGSGVCEPTDACAQVGTGMDEDVTESLRILVAPGAFGFLLSPSFG